MSIEARRGCGYRKVGGLYLCGSGIPRECDRLPYELTACPVCGSGIKFTRGFTWIDWNKFAGVHHPCKCILNCPICTPNSSKQPYGLLWVGEAYYSPQSFIKEALEVGVSKRIAFIPKELKLGETVVLLAHKKGILKGLKEITESKSDHVDIHHEEEYSPAVFYAFKPATVEMLVYESELTEERREELIKRGIIPISVLLANSIVQDGHGMLPMLANSRRTFFNIKGVNFVAGILFGAITMAMGF